MIFIPIPLSSLCLSPVAPMLRSVLCAIAFCLSYTRESLTNYEIAEIKVVVNIYDLLIRQKVYFWSHIWADGISALYIRCQLNVNTYTAVCV